MANCLGAVCCVLGLTACACSGHAARPSTWHVRFGPVIDTEVITGRAVAGSTAWIVTGRDALVRIDLERERQSRATIRPLAPGEHTWGLASLGRGGMWLLVGRNTLAEISGEGKILQRIELQEAHVNVFAADHELLYQVMSFQPPAQALVIGPPGTSQRRPWGTMTTRPMALVRGAVAALNLVACGASVDSTSACWFPDEAAVTVTAADGTSRRLDLRDLPTVSPEALLAAENPRRPIRDVFMLAGGEFWLLASGKAPAPQAVERPGGWWLSRYSREGAETRRVQLPEPARLILGASDDSCVVLAWDGRVVEVRP